MEKRTEQQNKALHKYFEMLASELNDAGLDMKVVLKPTVDIPWTKENIKEYIWKPVQKALLLKESTTELTTDEVTKVYETINRLIAEKHGIHIPFPTDESY